MALPRIALIVLGGTIVMVPQDNGGIAPGLTAEQLLASVPGLGDIAALEVVTKQGLPSASLSLSAIAALASEIDALYQQGVDVVVVVQGTDTIEESVFLLDLLVQSDQPLVVTGAMRGPAMPGADGPANLYAAVLVAASPAAAQLGALVVLNDEIHAARYVHKAHTYLPSAFTSPGAGPVGVVVEKRARFHFKLPVSIKYNVPPSFECAPVALVKIVLGDSGWMLDQLLKLEYAGVVVEGVGAGHVPAEVVPNLQRLAGIKPVVLSSRIYGGGSLTGTYGYAGSEIDLLHKGLISGGFLSGIKARLLLSVLLGRGEDPASVRSSFAQYLDHATF